MGLPAFCLKFEAKAQRSVENSVDYFLAFT